MKKRRIVLIILTIFVLIGLTVSAYFLYVYMGKCGTKECFFNSLVKCRRSSFVSESAETIIEYKIRGKSGNSCNVNVEMLQIKRGSAEIAVLEGKSMLCSPGLGLMIEPEKNLKNCHGELKEGIQNIIIQRLHAQIVENIGQIGEEVTKVF